MWSPDSWALQSHKTPWGVAVDRNSYRINRWNIPWSLFLSQPFACMSRWSKLRNHWNYSSPWRVCLIKLPNFCALWVLLEHNLTILKASAVLREWLDRKTLTPSALQHTNSSTFGATWYVLGTLTRTIDLGWKIDPRQIICGSWDQRLVMEERAIYECLISHVLRCALCTLQKLDRF